MVITLGIIYRSTVQGLEGLVVKVKNTTNQAYKYFVKAEALRLANHFKESIKHYLSTIMIDRTNYRAYLGLGIAYKTEENYEKAINALETARNLHSYDANVHYELGLCYLISSRFCEAIRAFHQAISLDKTNYQAQLQLAVAHEFIEEYDMALLIYHTIIENHPEFLTAYNHLSALYMNLKEFKSAGTVFSQVLKINPNFYKAYLGLAICFDKMGKQSRATHYYKMFLDKKPHSHHSTKIKKLLEKLQSFKNTEEKTKYFSVV